MNFNFRYANIVRDTCLHVYIKACCISIQNVVDNIYLFLLIDPNIDMDFGALKVDSPALENNAAKFKISIKPQARKASRRAAVSYKY